MEDKQMKFTKALKIGMEEAKEKMEAKREERKEKKHEINKKEVFYGIGAVLSVLNTGYLLLCNFKVVESPMNKVVETNMITETEQG